MASGGMLLPNGLGTQLIRLDYGTGNAVFV